MKNPDHFLAVLELLRPVVTYGVPLLFLYALVRMTGKSPLELSERFFGQFLKLAQGEKSLTSLNALTELLAFALIIILFASPLRDLFIPEFQGSDGATQDLILQGIIASLIFVFLSAGMVCLWLCSFESKP